MKKMSLKLLLLGVGMLFSMSADAQITNLLKNVLGNTKTETSSDDTTSETQSGGIVSLFKNLIGTAKVDGSSLKGNWSYESPAVVFESENLLKKAGGSLITSTAEKTLQKYLRKIGFEEGKVSISFDGDESYTMQIGTKSINGTYTVADNEITLQRTGLLSQPIKANLALQGNEMQITFKADKLLEFLTKISSLTENSTLNLIGNIAGGYDGMQLGYKKKKQ